MSLRAFVVLAAMPALAGSVDLSRVLAGIEGRYNKTQTLQVTFQETLSAGGRAHQAEAGELFLRKPGRMRWNYSTPAGKLFLSDSRNIYYYNPVSNRAEKMKFKESEDMRAPLAFLLGKLDFDKDFKDFRTAEHTGGTLITAFPKSDKLPYKQVDFLVAADFSIRELQVHGFDNSLLTFNFSNERVNPPLSDKIFQFTLPSGATWVDSTGEGEKR